LFKLWDGTRLTSSADWACRREQIRELLQYYEYGHLPPAPTSVTGTRNGNTLTVTVQANGRSASFNATLRLPSGNGPLPAIIMLNPLAASATSRGYAEVVIDPTSIAADSTAKTGAFWTVNGTGVDTGVLMAWAAAVPDHQRHGGLGHPDQPAGRRPELPGRADGAPVSRRARPDRRRVPAGRPPDRHQ
jgi:hypothetical protein